MAEFQNCLVRKGLGHISTMGSLFTWTNKRPPEPVLRRLDRMLGNKHWFSSFTESMVLVKPRGIMDHNPLMLNVPMILERFSKPFQFFNFMIELPDFMPLVEKAWTTRCFGDPLGVLCKKLKLVKSALVQLNKEHGNLHSNV